MSQLLISTIPGFVDLPDATIAADQPLTDYSITKISNNAKFAAIRPETFYGWDNNRDLAQAPAQAVDGYVYARTEPEDQVAAGGSLSPDPASPTPCAAPQPPPPHLNHAHRAL